MRFVWTILAASAVLPGMVAQAAPAVEAGGPRLRGTNFVAILPSDEANAEIQLRCISRSPRYGDSLRWTLIGSGPAPEGSAELARGLAPPGGTQRLSIAPTARLTALELDSGMNAVQLAPSKIALGYVASDLNPLRCVPPLPRMYFFVPASTRRVRLTIQCEVTGEGAAVTIRDPQQNVLQTAEGDFDNPQVLSVDAPRPLRDAVWSLDLERPKTKGLHLDKVVLWLEGPQPPVLTTRREWIQSFGRRATELEKTTKGVRP